MNKEYVIETNEIQTPLLRDCPISVKTDFVRKVYGIVAIQILFTAATAGFMWLEPNTRRFAASTPEASLIAGFFALLCTCPLYSMKHRHPQNITLLFIFTLFQSYVIGSLCVLYETNESGHIVFYSLATTSFIFGTLSAYVHISKKDMSFLGGMLMIGMVGLLFCIVVGLFLPTMFMQGVISTIGILLFSGFILHDTSEMINWMSPDDYVIASVQLYLDFINLFVSILEMLQLCSRE
jgi:FtsH-binding integral membrane protein